MEKIKVGYLGPNEMTFGYKAAKEYCDKRFGAGNADLHPCNRHEDIPPAVGNKDLDYGVIAIENTISGVVVESIQSLYKEHDNGIFVCGETTLDLEMSLLRVRNDLEGIKKIVSHIKGVSQCYKFLSKMLQDGVEVSYTSSTGEAAKMAIGNPDIAALGPSSLSKTFNLHVIQDNVADSKINATRFWIIGRSREIKTGKDKTAIMISLHQGIPGGIYHALEPFAKQGVNLCYIYACSKSDHQFEYDFLLEFEGHTDSPLMQTALQQLNDSGIKHSMLGSYPDATWDYLHPTVSVRIPTPLRKLTGGLGEVAIAANDIAGLVHALENAYPGIKERLCDEQGALRRFVNIYVNEEDIRFQKGIETAIKRGDEVSIVPAIAGGLPHGGERTNRSRWSP